MFTVFKNKGEVKYNFDKDKFRAYLYSLPDGIYELKVKHPEKIRSLRQNAYYWGVVIRVLADYCGYTDKEMHDALKFKFLRQEQIGLPDKFKSTKDLTTLEFQDYISTISKWANDAFSIIIPLPGDYEHTTGSNTGTNAGI